MATCTVGDYLRRATVAGLSWPVRGDLDDEALERLLFRAADSGAACRRSEPEWETLHEELCRKGMTLSLLWQEYKAVHPEGYPYSQLCERYRRWRGSLDVCPPQGHKAEENLFVDCAGQTMMVADPRTGELREVRGLVAVLGASYYTHSEATWTQGLPDWITSLIRTWEFLWGVAEMVVPDNLRSGVTSPSWYEPDVNPTYHDLATHNHMAVLPTSVRKPRDNAKAETGVQGVERWILAPLRHRTFFSLADCRWTAEHRNCLIVGPTGAGKRYLSCASGHKACSESYSTVYYLVPRLFQELAIARGDGRYLKLLVGLV